MAAVLNNPLGGCLVGTGFTAATARSLWQPMQPLRIKDSPFAHRLPSIARKGVVWTEPRLVAEVDYRGWTADQQLRHASYKGLREDKEARGVVREANRGLKRLSAFH